MIVDDSEQRGDHVVRRRIRGKEEPAGLRDALESWRDWLLREGGADVSMWEHSSIEAIAVRYPKDDADPIYTVTLIREPWETEDGSAELKLVTFSNSVLINRVMDQFVALARNESESDYVQPALEFSMN